MNRQNALRLASAGLFTVTLAGTSNATELYRDRAAWEAAMIKAGANLLVGDTFDREITNASAIVFDSGVISQGTRGGETNDVLEGAYFGNIDSDQDAVLEDTLQPADIFESITWTFPQPVFGFGADFFSTATGEKLLMSGHFGGEVERSIDFYDELGIPGDGFLGIVGERAFQQVTFRTREDDVTNTSNNEFWGADNLMFGWRADFGSDAIIKLGDPIAVGNRQSVPVTSSIFATVVFGATAFSMGQKPQRE